MKMKTTFGLVLSALLVLSTAAWADNGNGNGNGNNGNGNGNQPSVGGSFIGGIGAIAGYQVNQYSGNVGANSSSESGGGSYASGDVYGTGGTVQFTQNYSGGVASAGGNVNSNGVTTFTNTGSVAGQTSLGYSHGNAYGETGGGIGTDVHAKANGNFSSSTQGGTFGGFIGVAGFGQLNGFSGLF